MQDKRMTHNRLLEITALAGEFPNSLMSRLYGQNYKEKKASELRTKKLAKTYSRDGVRALRLTSRGRKYLLTKYPNRFMGIICTSNQLKPDLQHRLRYHILSGTYVSMDNAGVSIYRDERPALPEIPADFPFPAFYEAREIKGLDDEGVKIKGARFTGVLFCEHHIYICYNTGAVPLKWEFRAEQRTYALINALARELFPGRYSENDLCAIMIGDRMEVAYDIMVRENRKKKGDFYLDGVFDNFHYTPADSNGDFLIEVLYDEELYSRIIRHLHQSFLPPNDSLTVDHDGFDENGNPVLFAFDFDMKRIHKFKDGIKASNYEKAIAVCFDFQSDTLLRLLDESFSVHSISARQTRLLFGNGGAE